MSINISASHTQCHETPTADTVPMTYLENNQHHYFNKIYLLRLQLLHLILGMILELMGHCEQTKSALKIIT